MLAGCASPKPRKGKTSAQKAAEDAAEADQSQAVNSESGNAIGYSSDLPRRPLWKVGWNTVRIVVQPDGNTLTEMKQAHGTFLQDGKDASNFQSATGTADKATGDIDVDGQVTVVSIGYSATLRCDHIHYSSKGQQLVQATGHVTVDGKWGTVSGLQEVWATPDLKVFGTPDLFQKR